MYFYYPKTLYCCYGCHHNLQNFYVDEQNVFDNEQNFYVDEQNVFDNEQVIIYNFKQEEKMDEKIKNLEILSDEDFNDRIKQLTEILHTVQFPFEKGQKVNHPQLCVIRELSDSLASKFMRFDTDMSYLKLQR
jgi:hypothetical protein